MKTYNELLSKSNNWNNTPKVKRVAGFPVITVSSGPEDDKTLFNPRQSITSDNSEI